MVHIQEGHTRQINSLSIDDKGEFFVTGSRNKKIGLWRINGENFELVKKEKLVDSIKAVEIINEKVLVGYSTGRIDLLSLRDLKILQTIDESIACGKQINKIRKNPIKDNQFAVCSDDHTTRIYTMI